MTIDEAKQVFLSRGYIEVEGGTIYDADKWRESCRVISEWLEQIASGDAVSRQAVLSIQYRIDDSATLSTRDVVNVDDIENLPPATPQPKYGKWIRIDKDKCKCDQCEVISFIAMYPNGDKNYCPNCGAKMIELQIESEDKE